MVHAGLWQLQMGFWLYNIAKGNGPWNYVIYLLNIVILDGKLQTITYERLIIDPPERGIYWKYNYRKKIKKHGILIKNASLGQPFSIYWIYWEDLKPW